jgi:hypothetical protein
MIRYSKTTELPILSKEVEMIGTTGIKISIKWEGKFKILEISNLMRDLLEKRHLLMGERLSTLMKERTPSTTRRSLQGY